LDIVVNNAIEILTPIISNYMTARNNAAFDAQGKEVVKTLPEEECDMETYESTFDDFDELAVQYGYVCLFVVAFPLAPLLALISNYIEIRLDATKLAKYSRRPQPMGASDIGTWYDMLQIVSFVSVITNGLICIFFTNVVDTAVNGSDYSKVWVFLITEHLILGIKFSMAYLVDDEPQTIKLHDLRQEYLVDVLINGQDEEDEEESHEHLGEVTGESHQFKWEDVAHKPDQSAIAYAHGMLIKS